MANTNYDFKEERELEYMLAQLDLARYWLKEFEKCTKEEIIKSIKKFICEISQGAYCNEEE